MSRFKKTMELMARVRKIKQNPKAKRRLLKRKKISRIVTKSVEKRRAQDRRFRLYGIASISIAVLFLAILLTNIFTKGYSAFWQSSVTIPIYFEPDLIAEKNYNSIAKESFAAIFINSDIEISKRSLGKMLSKGAGYEISDFISKNPEIATDVVVLSLPLSSRLDLYFKGNKNSPLTEEEKIVANYLIKNNFVTKKFNIDFFTNGDSREPELAGIFGGLVGSIFLVIICLLLAFPLGVATAVYLEEFAPKNRLTEIIEVNINNLAAVPSIVFGLLGLSVYIQFFGIPRSSPLAGGLTLALMALPVIVITSRTAIRAVPLAIRDAATALGASKVQVTLHHVIPLSLPGIMTGTILSVARILGETAPLLMIGMVAFVVDIPNGFKDAATALPVQIYLWADSAELGFIEKTSAAIIILLLLLIAVNAVAIFIRKKFEIRW